MALWAIVRTNGLRHCGLVSSSRTVRVCLWNAPRKSANAWQQPLHVRLMCSPSAGALPSPGGQQQSRYSRYFFWRNRNFRRVFRVVRTVSILGSLGASCFALGQISYIDDPEAFEMTYLKSIVVNNEFTKVLAVDEGESMGSWLSVGKSFVAIDIEKDEELRMERSHPLVKSAARAQQIFHKVKKAMVEKVDEQIAELEKVNEDSLLRRLGTSEVDALKHKRKNLARPWTLVVAESSQANAFVDGYLPRRIFLTQRLMEEFIEDDAQLALILGHELSHFVLDHMYERLIQDVALRVVVVASMSIIDPSGGLGSFLMEYALPWMVDFGGAAFSRAHEVEADTLALEVCAIACYSPRKALEMFLNMQRYHEKMEETHGFRTPEPNSIGALLSSHPVDSERMRKGVELLPDALQVYEDHGCNKRVISMFFEAMGMGGSKPKQSPVVIPEEVPAPAKEST